jgi:hypothetical protein
MGCELILLPNFQNIHGSGPTESWTDMPCDFAVLNGSHLVVLVVGSQDPEDKQGIALFNCYHFPLRGRLTFYTALLYAKKILQLPDPPSDNASYYPLPIECSPSQLSAVNTPFRCANGRSLIRLSISLSSNENSFSFTAEVELLISADIFLACEYVTIQHNGPEQGPPWITWDQ